MVKQVFPGIGRNLLDTDFEILIPDDYVNSITERLSLYTKLNELKTEKDLHAFANELKDRFGELPIQVFRTKVLTRKKTILPMRLILLLLMWEPITVKSGNDC